MRPMRFLPAAVALALPIALVGCNSDEAKVERQTTISGPNGSSTVTETKKVESDGSNPPIEIRDNNTSPSGAPTTP